MSGATNRSLYVALPALWLDGARAQLLVSKLMADVHHTLAHLTRLEASRRAAGKARAQVLIANLPMAAQMLEAYGARRVVLFGSLNEAQPGPEADVDLAVEGLPVADYFAVLAELMALFGTRVDLVRLEEAPESLRERVEAEGRLL